MEPVSKYTLSVTVPDRDCDFKDQLRLSALFGYLQDIAALHAKNLGASVDKLKESFDVAWILMRLRVDILRMPKRYEVLTVETWPQKPATLYERDYLIKNENGEVLVKGVSVWILMNLVKREIVKETLLDYSHIRITEERAIDCRLGKIRSDAELLPALEKKIEYSDLDRNQHVNNTKYMDYAMDSIGAAGLETQDVKQVEVNYVNETKLGETIIISKGVSVSEKNTFYIEGTIAEDGRSAFKSKITVA
ncbi:MAG: acyl-ACP thioesterase [Clostridiales Family XIII bacterium]|jgi:acyl-ACP thioesterase|nr:acyl-ACP thioesterase [Clostridiales Family XIII bacterium]